MHILLMYSTHVPTKAHVDRLISAHPSIKVTVAKDEVSAIDAVHDSEVIFGHRYLKQCLPYAKKLSWIQSTASGIDRLPCAEIAQKKVLLTNMTIASPVIARHAMALAWAMTRHLPEAWRQQSTGIWNNEFKWLPHPSRAVVFGTGSIGQAIALLLNLDSISVTGVKKTVDKESILGFEDLCDRNSWIGVLPQMDWCFLALPNNRETHQLFDETALRALPKHAVLVNVGRGETLVTDDLCRVLKEGHLGGAALDVVHPEPNGPEDLIWQTPRLLITPHVAAHHLERGLT